VTTVGMAEAEVPKQPDAPGQQVQNGSTSLDRADEPEPDEESPEEKNRRVREYLERHPTATSSDVGKKLGYPEQTVRHMAAWKERLGKDKSKKKSWPTNERSLTPKLLATKAGPDADPSDLAAEQEEIDILQARYVDTLDARGRAEFFSLKRENQLECLAEFISNESTE